MNKEEKIRIFQESYKKNKKKPIITINIFKNGKGSKSLKEVQDRDGKD